MNIGIDIDDTISETFATLIPYSQKYSIEDLHRNPQLDYNIECKHHFYIEMMNHWNEEESNNFWRKYYTEMLETINIKNFAAETINKLKEEGHKIFIITARWDAPWNDTKQITADWLKKYNVNYDELIINCEDKSQIAKEKDIDIFIDDSLQNCQSVAKNANIKVLLMNTKANEKLSTDGIKRVFSWPEIQYLIKNNDY